MSLFKRDFVVLSFAFFWIVVALAIGAVEGGGPKVVVDADEKDIVRSDAQVFGPTNPPPELKKDEDAVTVWKVEVSNCSPQSHWEKIEDNYCTVEVTVKEVKLHAGIKNTVFLPLGFDSALQAHQEGHATIAEEVFKIAAKTMAEDSFTAFLGSFRITVDPCTEKDIRRDVLVALQTQCNKYREKARETILDAIGTTSDAYDTATDHGRHRPGGVLPTPDNQAIAARDAVKAFRNRFKKP